MKKSMNWASAGTSKAMRSLILNTLKELGFERNGFTTVYTGEFEFYPKNTYRVEIDASRVTSLHDLIRQLVYSATNQARYKQAGLTKERLEKFLGFVLDGTAEERLIK